MDKKYSKKSIDKLIYSLMAAMLALVVIVSIFTVSFRRGEGAADTDGTDMTTPPIVDTSDTPRGTDTSKRDTSSTDTTNTPDTNKPSDTTDKPAAADTDNTPVSKEIRYFVMPVVGSVSKNFEIDVPTYSLTMNDYRAHTGIDVAASLGSEVVAASGGTVCKIWNDPLMGASVTIDHGDNIYTTYMNLAEGLDSAIEVGAKVSMGQTIGAVGESAIIEIAEEPHLHLEMKVDGKYVDPLEYMGVSSEQDLEYEG